MLTTSLNPDDNVKAADYKEIIEFQHKPLTVEMVHKTIEKYFLKQIFNTKENVEKTAEHFK